ncbi:MAG: hypothetical protein HY317_05090 [Acidobacteria bacterium]|nr:hypothetical protein [Acidobacteriota bacterium]
MTLVRGGLALLVVLVAATVGPGASVSDKPARGEDAVSSLTLFAGTARGLFRSRDWGNNWERVQAGLEPLGAARSVLAMGPWVYVGGDGGLFFSEDFGETWRSVYTASQVLAVLTSRYPQADPTIFLGTPQGLLKSDDGRAFRPTPLVGTPVHRLEWPGPALVAATGRGVRVSDDSAQSFRPPGAGLPAVEVRALAVSQYFASDPVLFAGASSQGVFRSADGGTTWTAAGLEGRRVNDLVWIGPSLHAATDAGIFRSQDAGSSWLPIGEGVTRQRPERLLFPLYPPSGAEAFLATDGGLFWTGDGGSRWRPSGLGGEAVLCLGTFPPPDPVRKKGR